MKYAILCFVSVLSLGALGCKNKSVQSSEQSFEKLHDTNQVALIPDSEIKDFEVKKLTALGIPNVKIMRIGSRIPAGDAERREAPDETLDPATHFSTRITFGPINQSQFDALKKAFGGLSQVAFDSQKKEWDLIDFMPPLIQALDGHRFISHRTPMPPGTPLGDYLEQTRQDPELVLQTNCHATAYEVARSIVQGQALPLFTVFSMGAFDTGDFYLGDSIDSIPGLVPVAAAKARNDGRRVGDILQLYPINGVSAHSAVWLDNDLFFERVDSKAFSPYRLVTYADMLRVAGVAKMVNEKDIKIGYVRLDSSKIRTAEEIFGKYVERPVPPDFPGATFADYGIPDEQTKDLYVTTFPKLGDGGFASAMRMKSLKLVPDAKQTGRATLPATAFADKTFE